MSSMKKTLKHKVLAASTVGILTLGAAACASDGDDIEDPVEDVGDDIEDGVEDVGDDIEDGVDEMEDDG